MARNNYLHRIQVQNNRRNDFPIDMLRYDGLIPSREADSVLIALQCQRELEEREAGIPYPIHLQREADFDWQPNHRRWESFGFQVIDHQKERR